VRHGRNGHRTLHHARLAQLVVPTDLDVDADAFLRRTERRVQLAFEDEVGNRSPANRDDHLAALQVRFCGGAVGEDLADAQARVVELHREAEADELAVGVVGLGLGA
jgi:hypothetical protein